MPCDHQADVGWKSGEWVGTVAQDDPDAPDAAHVRNRYRRIRAACKIIVEAANSDWARAGRTVVQHTDSSPGERRPRLSRMLQWSWLPSTANLPESRIEPGQRRNGFVDRIKPVRDPFVADEVSGDLV